MGWLLLGAGPVESHFCILDMSLITHSNILHVHPAKCSWSLTKTAHHRATLTLTHNKTLWESQPSSLENENIRFCNEWFIIDFKVIFGRQFYSHNISAAQPDMGDKFCSHVTFLPTPIEQWIKWDLFYGVIRWWCDSTLVPRSNDIVLVVI
jgi:hypothetical protein